VLVLSSNTYVGVDIGSESSMVFIDIKDLDKRLKKPFLVIHDVSGFNLLLERLNSVESEYNSKCILIVENTGNYSTVFAHFFSSKGFPVKLINPIQTNRISKAGMRKAKTDKLDSILIAGMKSYNWVKSYDYKTVSTDYLKKLCRKYDSFVKQRALIKNQLSDDLDLVFWGYNKIFKDITCKTSMYILKEFTSPEDFLKSDPNKVINSIKQFSKRSLKFAREKYELIEKKAREALILSPNSNFKPIILPSINIIHELDESIASLEKEIIKLSKSNEEIKLVNSITGFGIVGSATIISELRDPYRFSNAKQMVAFAGLDPKVFESGKFKGNDNKITKRGSRLIRYWLFIAALTCVRKVNGKYVNKTIYDYYHKKLKEGKPKKVALIAICSKLMKIIFAVLRDRKEFVIIDNETHCLNHSQKAA